METEDFCINDLTMDDHMFVLLAVEGQGAKRLPQVKLWFVSLHLDYLFSSASFLGT